MGTRCLIHVKENNKTLVTIYRQFDGYPTGMGQDILDLAKGMKITNGISGDSSGTANGMGCFAAQLIKHLKGDVGNVYIMLPDTSDVWEEFTYTISGKANEPLHLTIDDIYDGLLDNFNPEKAENE